MVMRRSNYADQFFATALPVLERLLLEGYDLPVDLVPECFNVRSMDRSITQSSQVSGFILAPENAEGAAVVYDDLVEGYSKTYTALKYRLAAKITREMIEDGQYIRMTDLARELGKALQETRQIVSFNVFNNGFSDTGPDGVSLFNASHPLFASGGTDSNTASADLGITPLRNGINAMRDTRNPQGLRRPIRARKLIVPIETQWLAGELIGSYLKPQTADNDVNTLPNLQVVVADYLNLGSGVWILTGDKGDHHLNFFQRTPMQMDEDTDFDGDARKIAGRERFVVSYDDWRGTYGSAGA